VTGVRIHWDLMDEVADAARTQADLRLCTIAAPGRDLHEVRNVRSHRAERTPHCGDTPPHFGLIDRVPPDEGYRFIITNEGKTVCFHLELREDGLQVNVVLPAPPGAPSP